LFTKQEVGHLIHIPKIITTHKKIVVSIFIVAAILCIFLIPQVAVNYNMVDYLPKDAQSTIALKVMEKEFTQSVPNARVMLKDVSIQKALEFKEKLLEINGVTEVLWLDDVINLKEPIEMADPDTVEGYYKGNTALLSVTMSDGNEVSATDAIYELIGEENALAGNAVNIATAQKLSASESMGAFIILVPLILLILLLSTSSWIEPLFFLLTIGISVLINMGSNAVFGEVSFMTQSISPILQMAVSLDYAIFLLHSFEDYRKKTEDVQEAMQLAMRRTFPSIIASAATTLFGFVALLFMKFSIGSDLGRNLVKGIILSFISVMVFLPALTLFCYKWIDRTRHKEIIPSFRQIGKFIIKLKIPALVLAALIILPSFLAQSKADFMYGTGSVSQSSRGGKDEAKISEEFGTSTAIVLLIPKGDSAKEQLLSRKLEQIDHVNQVISYATMVGVTIPNDFLDTAITNQFYSKNYSRIILYTDTKEEGEAAFTVVEQVQNKAKEYYGDAVYSCGQSVTLYDMKNVVSSDTSKVNLIAILAIALVLLLTFRSISLPILLLITIETAIWINLSTPYFLNNSLCYIGYLVINTVQLGATVDYAILLTDNYRRNRVIMPKTEAIKSTLGESFHSILISATILSSAGFCLGLTSSNSIVSELGMLLGRGTLLSMAMVVIVLPHLLLLFDPVIKKTTLRANFYKEK
jgi:predicted RND superfamily exporter protein